MAKDISVKKLQDRKIKRLFSLEWRKQDSKVLKTCRRCSRFGYTKGISAQEKEASAVVQMRGESSYMWKS